MLQLVECPRDAMQGIAGFIPTETKVSYINTLLKAGFHTIDFGSFVSPKAIPQMADTAEVLAGLDLANSSSKLLAIVANARGAEQALAHPEIDVLGYPFSISETFQLRNTNAGIEASMERVRNIALLANDAGKELVLYVSMAFGNPYGDPWSPQVAIDWSSKLHEHFGIGILALSDTIGSSDRHSITTLFEALIPALPEVQFGAHLHTTPHSWEEKVDAAFKAGCRRFDGALRGYGGCPMAKDDLTGNMPTERMVAYFQEHNIPTGIHEAVLAEALMQSGAIFL